MWDLVTSPPKAASCKMDAPLSARFKFYNYSPGNFAGLLVREIHAAELRNISALSLGLVWMHRLRGHELAARLMDELEPCCLGAAVHIVIWLLTSSTFCQTVLTAILFVEGTRLSGGKFIFRCRGQNFKEWSLPNGPLLISARMRSSRSAYKGKRRAITQKSSQNIEGGY